MVPWQLLMAALPHDRISSTLIDGPRRLPGVRVAQACRPPARRIGGSKPRSTGSIFLPLARTTAASESIALPVALICAAPPRVAHSLSSAPVDFAFGSSFFFEWTALGSSVRWLALGAR